MPNLWSTQEPVKTLLCSRGWETFQIIRACSGKEHWGRGEGSSYLRPDAGASIDSAHLPVPLTAGSHQHRCRALKRFQGSPKKAQEHSEWVGGGPPAQHTLGLGPTAGEHCSHCQDRQPPWLRSKFWSRRYSTVFLLLCTQNIWKLQLLIKARDSSFVHGIPVAAPRFCVC